MLGKLFKYEMKSYRFSMGITFLVAIVFTLCNKVMCMIPYQGEMKSAVQMLSLFSVYYGIMFIAVVAQILIVIRFYSTMVGDRGYLTWTLPAKSSTILWSKALADGIWYGLSLIVVLLCYVLFLVGDYWVEEIDFLGGILDTSYEFFRMIKAEFGMGMIIAVCLCILIGIIASLMTFMFIYMCIAIGQLFGKWRILVSIVAYMVLTFFFQVIAIVIFSVCSVVGTMVFEEIEIASPIVSMNIILFMVVLLGIAVYAGLFAISNSIFKKHLNLE